MPEYVLNRNFVLSNTDGVVAFKKGEPIYVTPNMEKAAVAIGAQRVDGEVTDPLGEETPEPVVLSSDEREQKIFTAFEMLVKTNDAKDFTGQGVPSVKAVERLTTLGVERGEVLSLWTRYKDLKAEQ